MQWDTKDETTEFSWHDLNHMEEGRNVPGKQSGQHVKGAFVACTKKLPKPGITGEQVFMRE